MRRNKRYTYDYYVIDVPSDIALSPDERFDLAILQAREQARLYVMPCNWRLISDNGEQVKVCRERYNRNYKQ